MVTSDFRQEVEIIPFCACAMKKYAIWHLFMAESSKFLHLIGNRGREHDGDVRFLTESRNVAVLRMRNEKNMQFGPYLWLNRHDS